MTNFFFYRPLGKEAQAYARSDTHYLLYVYDRVRNDLIEKANGKSTLVEDVFFRATQLCKKVILFFKYICLFDII